MVISQSIINYAKQALIDELYATAIYSKLSKYYEGKDLSRKCKEHAEIERRHAKFWMEFLMERGVSLEGITLGILV